MCDSQYSSLPKKSENIKRKFEDSLDYLCVRGTSAPWSVAPRRVISAPHITAPTPRVYFCKKLQKGHICEILSRKELNCKNYGRSPRRDLRAIFSAKFFSEMPLPPRCRAARTWLPGSGAAGVYFCKFPNRKYIFVKNKNIKYKNKKTAARDARGKGQERSRSSRRRRGLGLSATTHGDEAGFGEDRRANSISSMLRERRNWAVAPGFDGPTSRRGPVWAIIYTP